MNDINKAQCWCNRLYKLMKEKNYTQKSFLKEYKEKYGGGTQANISRWLRVGSKIENGKTIGFPSYETMSNLADFFGVSVGYFIGETDYESFEMEKELPRFLLMENVTNILSKPHAADFGDWKETLENLGYYNKIYRLNAQNFGIPQKRERAYMISILCKNNAETIAQVEKYFEEHNLEKDEATRLKQRNLRLKDILCLDYDDVPRYKEEADASKPNDTPSRRKIWEDNELLYDGKEIRDIVVNTVTTKQDRNPNSGLIIYKNRARGKTKWRYLTPRECFKLMGFDESDFDRIISDNPMVTKNRYLYSTEKLIKLAGNSIVVDVLEAIFRQIMDINGKILGERK